MNTRHGFTLNLGVDTANVVSREGSEEAVSGVGANEPSVVALL